MFLSFISQLLPHPLSTRAGIEFFSVIVPVTSTMPGISWDLVPLGEMEVGS